MAAISSWPNVKVTAWPTSTPPTDGSMPTSGGVDITARVTGMSITRGRTFEMDADEAGTCSLTLRNDDRALNLPLGTPLQVTASWAGGVVDAYPANYSQTYGAPSGSTPYPVFTGYVTAAPWTTPDWAQAVVTVTVSDLLERWANRTLRTIPDEIICSKGPDWYWTGEGVTPLLGSSRSAVLQSATSTSSISSGFTGSMLGRTAFAWTSGEMANVSGRIGGVQEMAFPTHATWWGLAVVNVTNQSDMLPIFTLMDSAGNPVYSLRYDGSGVTYGSNAVELDCWAGAGGSSDTVTKCRSAYLGGDFYQSDAGMMAVILFGHDGTNLWCGAPPVPGYEDLAVSKTACGWPSRTPKAWSIGTPQLPGGATTWISAGPASGKTWMGTGDLVSGLALFTSGQPQPNDADAAGNVWTSAAGAEWQAAPVSATDTITRLATIGGGTVDTYSWNDHTKVAGETPYGNTLTSYLQDIATVLGGRAFVSKAGQIKLVDRNRTIPGAQGTGLFPTHLYGGTPPPVQYGAWLRYTGSPEFAVDLTHVANDVTVTGPTSSSRQIDAASVAQLGSRTMSVDTKALDPEPMAEWLLGRYRKPVVRVSALTLEPTSDPTMWPGVLSMELGDWVEIDHTTATGTTTLQGFVDQITHEATAGTSDGGTWRTTVQVAPLLGNYWIPGDTTLGVLGSTTIPTWGEGDTILGVGAPVSGSWLNGLIDHCQNLPFRMQAGSVSITPSAANTPTGAAVTFPVAFSGTPVILVCANTSVPGTNVLGVSVASPSKTGFTAYLDRSSTTTTGVFWLALGDIPTALEVQDGLTVVGAADLNRIVTQLNQLPSRVQVGSVTITPSAVNTPTSAAVTFPTAFGSAPVVLAYQSSAAPTTTFASAGSVSTTGFTAYLTRTDNLTSTTVKWIAVGS